MATSRYLAQPHGGTDNNLHLADAPDGGLILRCWSTGCTFNEILRALQVDGLAIKRAWTYPNDKVVTRIDRGGAKDIKSPGTTKGVELLITNDSPDALIVITEGESDRDAVLSAGLPDVAAACFVGGAHMAGDSNYGAVKGRRVAIWPDNDIEGQAALLAASLACEKAGAAHVYAVDYVGKPDSKQGAADLNSVGIELHLRAERLEAREWSAQSFRLVWVDLAESTRGLAADRMVSARPNHRWGINPLGRSSKSGEDPSNPGPNPGHDSEREVSRP